MLVKRFPRLSETFILNEFLELRRQGLPVSLCAVMDPREKHTQPEALELVPEVTYLQADTLRAELPAALRTVRRHPWGALRAGLWVLSRHSRPSTRNFFHALVLLDRLADGPAVHLHAHFLHAPGSIAFIANKVSGVSYSLTGHAKDIYTTLPENLRMRAERAEFVTTCTGANAAYLTDQVGIPAEKLRVCRHGVDVARFVASGRDPRPGRILSIGRLVPKKGFDVLIEALALALAHGVDCQLRIVGSGELRQELLDRAADLGLADRVTLVGSCTQDEIRSELAQAEMFVLAPRVLADGDRDGIPNVILEAMAAGVPVISTAISGIPEAVTDTVTGLLVPERDAAALAAAIHRLATDPALRAAVAERAQTSVARSWTWPSAVAPLYELLDARIVRAMATAGRP